MSAPLIDQPLGLPAPQGPTLAPQHVQLQMLQLATKYLLYERARQTHIVHNFAAVCAERHENFHSKHVYLDGEKKGQRVPFAECSNTTCQDARNIISDTEKQEVFINPLSAQLMSKYVLNFMPMPNQIRFWIAEAETQAQPEQRRIVIAG
jgi:hypothetical protein